MQSRLAVLAAPLLGLLECGPIAVPTSGTPVNTCTGTVGCAGDEVRCETTESGNACVSTLPLPNYVLVVNVPEGAVYAPGEVFTLTPDQIACVTDAGADCTTVACQAPTAGSTCLELPQVSTVSGDYVAEDKSSLSSLLGNSSGVSTTVPVQAIYVPQWTLSPPACEPKPCQPTIEASLLNLPLPTVVSGLLSPVPGAVGIIGPEATATTGWTVFLPPLSSGYLQVVDVASPFDVDFPPLIQQMSSISTFDSIAIAAPFSTGMMSVAISPPEEVKGWTVWLQDRATRRIVSSQPVVQDGGVTLQLYPSSEGPTSGNDIVLSPPKDAIAIPEFVDSYIAGQPETYPTLPDPVVVSGTVVSPAGMAVSAALHFVSTALYNYPPIPTSPLKCTLQDNDANLLHYEVVLATADRLESGGAVGKYSVVLPQGQYEITVDPDVASGFAKTQIKTGSDASSGIDLPPVTDPPCTTTQQTFDIPIEPLLSVTGMVSIADGRSLANATVEITPAASLLTSQPMPLPGPSQLAQADGPRPFQVTTAIDGSFNALVDPGTYDVTVRPTDGTRLPWIVSPSHLILHDKTKLDALVVPAPVPLALTLHDPAGPSGEKFVSQAVVRAYAFTSCTPPAGGTCNGVALQIGQAFTDSTGSFEMFLTPSPFTAEAR